MKCYVVFVSSTFWFFLQEFEGDDMYELCLKLKELATDSNKYRAKKDRRQQRSSFRDVLRAVEVSSLVVAQNSSLRICSSIDQTGWIG